MSSEEVSALLPTCEQAKNALEPFLAGLAFALMLPRIFTNGQPLTLLRWKWLWEACTTSVSADGLEPTLLVNAEWA